MSRDPARNSDYEEQLEAVKNGRLEVAEEGEPIIPDHPTCPRCGWHNTRASHTTGILDAMLRSFWLRPYRCRSCGNRFRVIRRLVQN